jgi:hypothetical protein
MTEKFLDGQKAGLAWRESASADELKRVRMAAESLGKRGVADAARRQTGSSNAYAIEFNLGFAVGALVVESESTVG